MGFIAAAYGVVCYAVFRASFLYSIGFVGNLVGPTTIDSHPGASVPEAFVVNLVLLGLFAVQHSVMARPGFKAVWTRVVPRPVERSTYVLISSLLLALFALGWLIVLLSTFMINHFELFGLRQVYLRMRGLEYTPLNFTTRALYGFVRHPIMLEERDLVRFIGPEYEAYRRRVPMLIPASSRRG